MRCLRGHSHAGISLIELMASIAIVVLLLTLLFFYQQRAAVSVRNIECVSNLRHLGNAFLTYAQDHDMTLPRRSIAATDTSPASNWVFLMTGFLDNGHDYIGARVGPNLVTLKRKAMGMNSPLLCTQNSINAGSPENSTATTYAMNNNCSLLNLNQSESPSMLALLVEGMPTSQQWPISLPAGSSQTGVNVHGGHGNVLFLDGHVDSIKSIPAATSPFWVPF